jgi:antitoxin (DNA-binding transcriptional repressor) of toxin-antitoxin stability system
MPPIYLDYDASTLLDLGVLDACCRFCGRILATCPARPRDHFRSLTRAFPRMEWYATMKAETTSRRTRLFKEGNSMHAVLTVEEAQSNLKDLIDQLAPDEEIVITKNQQPVAKLVRERLPLARPAPGLGKGSIVYMAPDFDEPLEEFREYLE